MKKSIIAIALVLTVISCEKDDEATIIPPPPSTVCLPEEFSALENIFGGNGIGAAVNLTEDIVLFFNIDGDKYAWYEDNEVHLEKNLSDTDSHFSNFALNSVSASTLVSGTTVYLFDNTGNEYTTMSFDAADVDEGYIDTDVFTFSTNTHQLFEWGPDNTCPFNQISAMLNYSEPNSCFNATEDNLWTAMINGSGDEYVWYQSSNGGSFGAPEEIENWVFDNLCNGPDGLLPFEKLSATCRYMKPNGIQELFFNEDGKTFVIQNVSEGVFSKTYSMY